MLESNKLKQVLCKHEVLSNEKDYWTCKECGKIGTEYYFSTIDRNPLYKALRWVLNKIFNGDDNDPTSNMKLV